MTQHRFLNDGRSPIPMGGAAEYACVCGKRGTHESIEHHITWHSANDDREARDAAPTAPYDQLVDGSDDFGDGNTKAHYLPMEPREPAPPPFNEEDSITPTDLPPPAPLPARSVDEKHQELRALDPVPSINRPGKFKHERQPLKSKPNTAHQQYQRSIAESFQDMLRAAFQAGAVSTTTGESFETWYQREVLQ